MPRRTDSEYLAFVRGRVGGMRRAAHLLCGDSHAADDIVQETLTKLYTRWPRISHVENLDAYVNTMLVRVFLDDRRRGWWKVALLDWLPERTPAAPPPAEDRSVVRQALMDLPPRQRAVVVLRYLCDQPVKEVALILGCSEGTVKSQSAHALDRLRQIFDEKMPEITAAQDRP
ncbi:SigE family RNA polymerase sigma factor [Paractinoplanes brasiliensis]|uniref:RNA polymerase sigma-70 factor (Sigma-E family) n=1 Tax=Paractinoplanes brasiliensis TaxID=52695 RepID=A0A4R6J820_9ACTN|nr:SigE family RNA polymerase sigma factor [Actinoplanes brasiliensis]TDO31704.1 RNA polymerase sigma-70 factor (sigma-E family) [Actinoplanes brasiliensis]GID30702.1 RNA polymerase sigma24 factor [Actinoplanes brasiliensis]